MNPTERVLLLLSATGLADALCGLIMVLTEPCCGSVREALPAALVLAAPTWLVPLRPWRDPQSLGLLAARWVVVLWLGAFLFVVTWGLADQPAFFVGLFAGPFRPSPEGLASRVMGAILGVLLPVMYVTLVVEARRGWRHMIAANTDPA